MCRWRTTKVSSIFDPNPVIFLEHRWLHNTSAFRKKGDYQIKIGKSKVCNKGKDVTIAVTAPSGNIAAVDQVTVPSNGIFQIKFVFDRQDTGTYTVTAKYAGLASDSTTFKFTKSQIESSSTRMLPSFMIRLSSSIVMISVSYTHLTLPTNREV